MRDINDLVQNNTFSVDVDTVIKFCKLKYIWNLDMENTTFIETYFILFVKFIAEIRIYEYV